MLVEDEESGYLPARDARSPEQDAAIQQAAILIINARRAAAELLSAAGIKAPRRGPWGSPCGVTLPPPPSNHPCGCNDYRGDGGPCRTRYRDATGPNLGEGWPWTTCRHLPEDHIET
jgi:hypothetical protein